jgi:hypothetical protein
MYDKFYSERGKGAKSGGGGGGEKRCGRKPAEQKEQIGDVMKIAQPREESGFNDLDRNVGKTVRVTMRVW